MGHVKTEDSQKEEADKGAHGQPLLMQAFIQS